MASLDIRPFARVTLALALPFAVVALAALDTTVARGRVPLVFHVENAIGEELEAHTAETPINPASLVKVATTLWSLERLGPRHRFVTRFAKSGTFDPESGILEGDLVVFGSGDPDFHIENAFLVARALADRGLHEVRGRLVVSGDFWIGWEGGSDGALEDETRRAMRMGLRLRDAFDPVRWGGGTTTEWRRFTERRGLDETQRPRIVIRDGVGLGMPPGPAETWFAHESNGLVPMLKRFNTWSNNDIERLEATLGRPHELADFLAERWGLERSEITFATLSGLGTNRLTPRIIVKLMQDLRLTLVRHGLDVDDILPVAGCDPGTLRAFRRLREEPSGLLVAKTGTLTHTDNGITVLAGYAYSLEGLRVFCVAAPRSAGRIDSARRAEESWLLERFARWGGGDPRVCGPSPWHSDADARIVVESRPPEAPAVLGATANSGDH